MKAVLLSIFRNSLLRNPASALKNLKLQFASSISQEPHIFVLGAPRSGTTLMQALLLSHPGLAGVPFETGMFIYRNLYDDGIKGIAVDDFLRMRSESQDIVDLCDRVAAHVTRGGAGRRCVDKTPQHVLRLRFLLRHFPEARFIHMIRDGRDGYCSARKHEFMRRGHGRSAREFALYWRRCIRARRREGGEPRIHYVRFEDLVVRPEETMSAVMAFLGLDFRPEQIRPETYSRFIDGSTRSRKAFKKLNRGITPERVGVHKTELTHEEKAVFGAARAGSSGKTGTERRYAETGRGIPAATNRFLPQNKTAQREENAL